MKAIEADIVAPIATENPQNQGRWLARCGIARRVFGDPWILAALACALVLRLYHLDTAALWLDETETAIVAMLSPDQMMQTALHRVSFGRYDPRHLPLYFFIVNCWTQLVGFSPWLLRLPSVLFSLVTVALTACIGQTLAGERVARWAAWLAAISPFLLHHAQEARMYPLVAALSGASVLLLVRYLAGQARGVGVAFVLVNAAMLATHYYTVFLVAGELLLLLSVRPQPYRNWAPAWLACALSVVLLCYVALFLTKQSSGEIYALGAFAMPGVGWSMLTGYTMLPSAEELHAAGMAAARPYMPYAIAGALPTLVVLGSGLRVLEPRARTLIAMLAGCVLLGPFLAHVVFARISVHPRYFTAAAPMFLIALAAGMPRFGAPWWRIGAAVVVLLLMITGSVRNLTSPGQQREDVAAAGAWLDRHVASDEEIFVTSDEMASLAFYHWPVRRITQYPPRNIIAHKSNAEELARDLPIATRQRLIFIFGRSWLSDPEGKLEKAINSRYASCGGTEVRGIRIYCLLPHP